MTDNIDFTKLKARNSVNINNQNIRSEIDDYLGLIQTELGLNYDISVRLGRSADIYFSWYDSLGYLQNEKLILPKWAVEFSRKSCDLEYAKVKDFKDLFLAIKEITKEG